jgi:hypothetical protein
MYTPNARTRFGAHCQFKVKVLSANTANGQQLSVPKRYDWRSENTKKRVVADWSVSCDDDRSRVCMQKNDTPLGMSETSDVQNFA